MGKELSVTIDDDVYSKLQIVLSLTEEDMNTAINNSIRAYIVKAFKDASHELSNGESVSAKDSDYYGKAIRRIPIWATKPNQYNHKIIRAYFRAVEITDEVTPQMLERLCSDKDYPEIYVPNFKSNYSQMKFDGSNSHGKVFEESGNVVTIWSEVEDVLMKYKSSFTD